MAKHNVYVNLPPRELGKADAIFDVYTDNKKKLALSPFQRGRSSGFLPTQRGLIS